MQAQPWSSARRRMGGGPLRQRPRKGAARMERAAGRGIERARRLAAHRRQRQRDIGVDLGDRGDEGRRIRMARRAEHALGRPLLDDPAEIHHRDPVAEPAHDGEIVRDEDQRQADSFFQVEEEVDHLSLDRDVERGDAFVGDDEARLDRQRPGDADTLALAARKRRRTPVCQRRIEADHPQKLGDAGPVPPRGALPWTRRTSARVSPTVRRGLSEFAGSWNTMAVRRRSAFRSARRPSETASPSSTTWPPEIGSRPRSARPSVDLPDPDSPTIPIVSPRRT